MIFLSKSVIWNPKMEVWKMIFLFYWVIFRFHVNFPGCKKKLSRQETPNSVKTKCNVYVTTLCEHSMCDHSMGALYVWPF